MRQFASPDGTEESADALVELHRLLRARGERIVCAESLTGGLLAGRLTDTPGASATFAGGVVSYATEIKRELLGVLAEHVVSPDCAREMAFGVRRLLQAEWALSTTGVAGPDPQEGIAPGTAFVGLAGPAGITVTELHLSGSRAEIRGQVVDHAVELAVRGVGEGTHGG